MQLKKAPVKISGTSQSAPYHEWLSPDGSAWADFYRQDGAYLIRFIGQADFIISGRADNIDVYPAPGLPQGVLDYLFLDLVEPLAISHRGELVVHAGAIEIEGGAALFSGPSGSGKSTLVASFTADGYRFVNDDAAQLVNDELGYWVQPRHHSLRLCEDSGDALLSQFNGVTRLLSSSDKATFVLNDQSILCREACQLRHIYFLEDESAEEISIRPLSGSEAMIRLATHSFSLDVSDKISLARKFENIARIAALPIFFSLAYPRRYELLPEVREAVVKHLQTRQWKL